MIVSIDPGTKCSGFAVFAESDTEEKPVLIRCGVFRGDDWIDTANHVPEFSCENPDDLKLIIEDPRIYPVTNVRPNDLMKLSAAVGAIVAKVSAKFTKLVTPSQWKKSVPKTIHQKRIWRTLNESEKEILDSCLCPKSLHHNVVDAVGIGLWHVGRMK